MDSHEELVEIASTAIQAVFGDASVDQATTLNSLELLADEIESMIGALDVES